MCGIAGFVDNSSETSYVRGEIASRMIARLKHRGPDSRDVWSDKKSGIIMAHARLAILDLSPAGHQPMHSESGRLTLVFNGEIYNHLELRKELESQGMAPQRGWRGHSDTETLLQCLESWGFEETLTKTVGMFAFACWDSKDKRLYLARDRIGEKPLYYGWQGSAFLFASELKALRQHPHFTGELDKEAILFYMHLGYIPAPLSIYSGIKKLPPGCFLILNQEAISRGYTPEPRHYWSLEDLAMQGGLHPFEGDFEEAVDKLEELLLQSVKMQSIADVPVGAFLSGGVDSSTLVTIMQAATTSKVTTFSIGMPEARLNEAHFAKKVAEHLGTNHVEHVIQPEESLEIIPDIPLIWDEPFADSSQIPTHLVCKLAKKEVTVALSGDGGDEFFLGYRQYILFEKFWKLRLLKHLPWKILFSFLNPFSSNPHVEKFLRRSRAVINAISLPDGQRLNTYWMDKFRQAPCPLEGTVRWPYIKTPPLESPAAAAGLWDAAFYLPDDILVKVDRAAMAISLETRAPFLDHRVIEFALSLPLEFKLYKGTGKKILRHLLYRYVPRSLVDRPKMGFSIPLSFWLKKELRPWAQELLQDKFLLESSGLKYHIINQLWQEHLNGHRDHTDRLWIILCLLAYIKKWSN